MTRENEIPDEELTEPERDTADDDGLEDELDRDEQPDESESGR